MAKNSSAQNCKSCIRNNESNRHEVLYTLHVNLCTELFVQLNHNMSQSEVDTTKGCTIRLNNEELPF